MVNQIYSNAEKARWMMVIGDRWTDHSVRDVINDYRDRHPGENVPDRKTITTAYDRFVLYGEFGYGRPIQRHRPGLTEDVRNEILRLLTENGKRSVRNLAHQVQVSYVSVWRFIRLECKFKPYKPHLHQRQHADDPERRVLYCEALRILMDADNTLKRRICYTDECKLLLNNKPNKQNDRWWCQINPRYTCASNDQSQRSINVWAGIVGDHIIGPFFFHENLNGERYLNLLQNFILPAINAVQEEIGEEIWFQQDGAPAHRVIPVRNLLNENFRDRWIGMGGPMDYPARSPDLTPMDFFFWGYIKNQLGGKIFNDFDQLIAKVYDIVETITVETLRNVCNMSYDRLAFCEEVDGGIFENML